MELERIKIYRITHIANIPHILIHGLTHKKSIHANPDYVPIGDANLIDKRAGKSVPVTNGLVGKMDIEEIVLGDYIPFNFWIKMPMLFVIQHGGNFVPQSVAPEEIIYISCKLIDIMNSKKVFYFSDGHPTDKLSVFYDKSQIKYLPTLIDWLAIKEHYWANPDNKDVKRKKQAEMLIEPDIPTSLISSFGCCNERVKQTLVDLGIATDKITASSDFYY
jgi:hypothetical protein